MMAIEGPFPGGAPPEAPPPPGPIPFSLDYTAKKPVGLGHRIINARWLPTGSLNNNISTNDQIIFQPMTRYFLDPYSTMIECRVKVGNSKGVIDDVISNTNYRDVSSQDRMKVMTHKCMQLDGSSLSLLSSIIIKESDVELERIHHVDVLMSMLRDVTYGRAMRTTKDYEGLGGQMASNFTNIATRYHINNSTNVYKNTKGDGTDEAGLSKRLASKNTGLSWPYDLKNITNYLPYLATTEESATSTENALGSSHVINSSYYDPLRNYTHKWTGIPNNYNTHPTDPEFQKITKEKSVLESFTCQNRLTDYTTRKFVGASPVVQHVLYDCPNLGFETPFLYNKDNFIRDQRKTGNTLDQVSDCVYPNDPEWIVRNQRVSNLGYHQPFPANFGTTTFEPILSFQPQRCIYQGQPAVKPLTTGTFYIPLPSGIFGSLMNPSNYRLIPMVAFKNLTIEVQLNPYAFFTSWSSTDIQSRDYKVDRMILHAELVEWFELPVISATNKALANGFVLTTTSWCPGPQFNFAGNAIPQTISVNLGFDSLKTVLFCFLDGAYKSNTMYRKLYRMSGNLTSMQLKIGTDYLPQQRIEGNSGNNYGDENCYPFYIETMKAMGSLMSTSELAVNPHNYAINWRESYAAAQFAQTYQEKYWTVGVHGIQPDPAFVSLHTKVTQEGNANGELPYNNIYDVKTVGLGTDEYKFPLVTSEAQHQFNLLHFASQVHTGSQLSFYLENRVVGKAMYAFDLDSLNFEQAVYSGIRTKEARPFELILSSDITNPWIGTLEFFSFFFYDLIVNFSNGTVSAFGR